MPRVLVVEDERKILRSLEQGLRAEGYDVATAATGEEGYRLANTQPFDCVVLDLLLPGCDGLQVLGDLRRAGKALPVLILTARDAIEDRVIGLDAGADGAPGPASFPWWGRSVPALGSPSSHRR
jgi:DNA-binding response OmpR family regulator